MIEETTGEDATDNGVSDQAAESEDATQEGVSDETETDGESEDAPQLFKVTVDGQEQELTQEQLIKGYQSAAASNQRFEQASKMADQSQAAIQIVNAIRNGNTEVLSKLMPEDARRKDAEAVLLKVLEFEQASPEEQRAIIAEQKAMAAQKESEDLRKRNQQTEMERLEYEQSQKIESEMMEAFEEQGLSLAGNDRLVARVCEDVLAHVNMKKKTTTKAALKRVLKSMENDYAEHIERSYKRDPKSFIDGLPKYMRDEIRKRDLEQVSSQLPIGQKQGSETKPKPRPDDEFTAYMRGEMRR